VTRLFGIAVRMANSRSVRRTICSSSPIPILPAPNQSGNQKLP
jgi:hypothetical protein